MCKILHIARQLTIGVQAVFFFRQSKRVHTLLSVSADFLSTQNPMKPTNGTNTPNLPTERTESNM